MRELQLVRWNKSQRKSQTKFPVEAAVNFLYVRLDRA